MRMGSSGFPYVESSNEVIVSDPPFAGLADSLFFLAARFSADSLSRISMSMSLKSTMMSSMTSGEVTSGGKTSLTSS